MSLPIVIVRYCVPWVDMIQLHPMHEVYVIESLRDGKTYVGVSWSSLERWKAHVIGASPSNAKVKNPLDLAIAEQGATSFRLRIVARMETRRDALGYERLYTHLLESNDPRFGYNSPFVYKLPRMS